LIALLAKNGRGSSLAKHASARRKVVGLLILSAPLFAALFVSSRALSQQPAAVATSAPDASRTVQFLDQTIGWYRQTAAQQKLVSDASDAVYASGDRLIAEEVVRVAFQFARAEAQETPEQAAASQAAGQEANTPYANLLRQEAKAEQDLKQVQGEVADLRPKVAAAVGKKRQALEAQLAETQSEVDLGMARVEAFRKMAQFMSGATTGPTDLTSQIDALASIVPAELSNPNATSTSAPLVQPPTPVSSASGPVGLWDAGKNLLATVGKLRAIGDIVSQTQVVAQRVQEIRTPMVVQLRQLAQQGDQLAQQADTATPDVLVQEKAQLNALTQQFKQLTSMAIPVDKIAFMLNQYQSNLANWRASTMTELFAQLRSLLVHALIVVIILGLLFLASELWRRAIYRYVHDSRHRSQMQWMRKVVVWFLIAIVVLFSFVSQLGSMATFAGLLTAGIAVALQNVLQSIVGYFLLIGKYGIHTGDRVQIGGVTGEVIDVGLIRIHLMEMGGTAQDAPTGRVVAFSNSIVFQATPGIFKQIPGTNFAWHQVTLALPAGLNPFSARENLLKAVQTGLAEYKEEIARQHSAMEDTFEATAASRLEPTVQLQFTSSGLEATVRYPVALPHAMEIDERVAHALLSDPELGHSGAPYITVKTSPAT
jgi:small-conductance mechanosensitive channel